MRLYFVRHGETKHNADKRIQGSFLDDPLNARGLLQAAALEARFAREYDAGLRLAALYSSPLQRAWMTAERVARGARVPPPSPTRSAGLAEFSWGVHLGRTETGETLAEMKRIHEAWREGKIDVAPEHGESPRSAFQRAWTEIGPLVDRHARRGETIALAGHGRLFKILLAKLVADDLSRMDDYPQGNTAVTILERDDDPLGSWESGWRVVLLNDQSHLDGVVGARAPPHASGPALV